MSGWDRTASTRCNKPVTFEATYLAHARRKFHDFPVAPPWTLGIEALRTIGYDSGADMRGATTERALRAVREFNVRLRGIAFAQLAILSGFHIERRGSHGRSRKAAVSRDGQTPGDRRAPAHSQLHFCFGRYREAIGEHLPEFVLQEFFSVLQQVVSERLRCGRQGSVKRVDHVPEPYQRQAFYIENS